MSNDPQFSDRPAAAGVLSAPDELRHGELAAFEPSSEAVEFEALTNAEFVLGSAAPHKHDLVLGYYSVHTTPDALREGEAARCKAVACEIFQVMLRSSHSMCRVTETCNTRLASFAITAFQNAP